MINLLPIEDQLDIKKKHEQRLSFVIAFFILVLMVTASILLSPIFFLLFTQEKLATSQLETVNERLAIQEAGDIYAELEKLNFEISLFEENQIKIVAPSLFFKLILENKPIGVKLQSLKYENNGQKTVVLRGISDTRANFLIFKNNLEQQRQAKKVISPVSNLLKNNDVNFVINIEL